MAWPHFSAASRGRFDKCVITSERAWWQTDAQEGAAAGYMCHYLLNLGPMHQLVHLLEVETLDESLCRSVWCNPSPLSQECS